MCLTPIRIYNPTRRYLPGTTKSKLTVPCGHCKECVKTMQDNWFIRSVYECKRVQNTGGAVWFPTLTYNNDNLPYWNDEENNVNIPCFDKEHFKSFRNKLRIYLKREGYEFKEDTTIRFIYCCEYGGKHGRPHLHVMLYVPSYVPASVMKGVLEKAWIYGYVMWSKKGMIAQSLKAAQYCMKYISKDMNYMKKYNIYNYIDILKKQIKDAKDSKDELRYNQVYSKLKELRRHLPHHGQSMKFGIDGLDYYKNEQGEFDVQKCLDGTIDASKIGLPPLKSGDSFKYRMPMYYYRKIFCYTDEYGLLRPNQLSLDLIAYRFNESVERQANIYLPYLQSEEYLREHLAPILCKDEVAEIYKKLQSFAISPFFHATDIAKYNIVYRDVALLPSQYEQYICNRGFENWIELDDDGQIIPPSFSLSSQKIDQENMQGFWERIRNEKNYFNYLSLKVFLDDSLNFMLSQKNVDIVPTPEGGKHRPRLSFNDIFQLDGFIEFVEKYELLLGEAQTEVFEEEMISQSNLFGKESNYTTNPFV